MGKGFVFRNKLLQLLFLLNIAVILILSGCSKGNEPEQDKANFGLYLLEDQSITWEDLKTKNLDSLKLKEWITSDKIDFYDYSTHVIYLNVDYNTLFTVPHNDNTPFVVVANNKRCYYGRFAPPKDTTQPYVVIKPLELCNDLIMLEFNPPHRKDIRVNEEVKKALTEIKKIKLGFSNIYFYRLILVPDSKTSAIEYSFTVKNMENETLYFIGLPYFRIKVNDKIYQTKLVIYNDKNCFYLPATDKYGNDRIVDAAKMWYKASFYDFPSKLEQSLGWDNIFPVPGLPNGNYNCYIEYYGMMGGEKERRSAPDGRIWIGYFRTNTMNVDYDSLQGITINSRYVELN